MTIGFNEPQKKTAAEMALGYYAEWTCDEIAECIKGITTETYVELWNIVSTDPNAPVRMYWNNLTETARANVTESLEKEQARIDAL